MRALGQLKRAKLEVYDGGSSRPMRFDAVIGTPEVVRVAHHRHALHIRELLADGDTRQADLWDVRTYVRSRVTDGWARYEPEGDE